MMEISAEKPPLDASADRTKLPAYEEWPSVPKGVVKNFYRDGDSMSGHSALSIEDIEAAQALEGLRAGTCSLFPIIWHLSHQPV